MFDFVRLDIDLSLQTSNSKWLDSTKWWLDSKNFWWLWLERHVTLTRQIWLGQSTYITTLDVPCICRLCIGKPCSQHHKSHLQANGHGSSNAVKQTKLGMPQAHLFAV